MRKITLTKGLPGSGKTTWAKISQKIDPNIILVSKDDLRNLLHQGVWSRGREEYVLAIRDQIILKAIKEGHDVIVHDTNLSAKHETHIRAMVEGQAQVEIKDFTDVTPEECIKNDLKRENSVGEKVIRDMYKRFLKPKVKPVLYDPSLPVCIICDLDGTLALFGNKNPYERDFTKDEVNLPIADLVHNLRAFDLIIVSGRKDIFRDQTEKWLQDNEILYNHLYMRKTAKDGQQEPKDVIVKREIYETYIKGKYNVAFVLDDRNSVVQMWRDQGLTCLQVAEGDF